MRSGYAVGNCDFGLHLCHIRGDFDDCGSGSGGSECCEGCRDDRGNILRFFRSAIEAGNWFEKGFLVKTVEDFTPVPAVVSDFGSSSDQQHRHAVGIGVAQSGGGIGRSGARYR